MSSGVRKRRRYAEEIDQESSKNGLAWLFGSLLVATIAILLVGYFFVIPFVSGVLKGIETARKRNQGVRPEQIAQRPVVQPANTKQTLPILTVSKRLADYGVAVAEPKKVFVIEALLSVSETGKRIHEDMIRVSIQGKNNTKCKDGWMRFPVLNPGEKAIAKIYLDNDIDNIESITLDLK